MKFTNKSKTIFAIVAFVVFICIAVFAYNTLSKKVEPQGNIGATNEGTVDGEEQKMLAPDFTILDREGKEVKLSELFGKPIVINFWASWCSPCKSEMPDFNKVYEEMGDEITFVMIDLVDGQRETMEIGEKYVTEQGYTFPVYFDSKQEAAYTYGISSVPTTFFLDKEGYIITGARGVISEKSLRKGIDLIK